MASNDFGIYVQTYPGDLHLSTILVLSIQQVSPDIPIAIIPGDDFEYEAHPFDVPIMESPGGFFEELGHKDRSFWAFQGPFETFLFLDADMICVKSLDGLARRAVAQEGDFILVQPWMDDREWQAVIGDPAHPKHERYLELVRSEVGRGPLAEFDPDHDFHAHYPINTGAFVSRRGLIGEKELRTLNEAERKFYRERLGVEWSWPARDLFFYDQGRMNYLLGKRQIPILPLEPELVCVQGSSAVRVSVEDVEKDALDFHLIHWMGAKSPSPSFFCAGILFRAYAFLWAAVGRHSGRSVLAGHESLPECTGYSLWLRYREERFGRMPLSLRLRWSWPDLKRTAKLLQRWLRDVRPWTTGRRSPG